jgi:hypothetical protein
MGLPLNNQVLEAMADELESIQKIAAIDMPAIGKFLKSRMRSGARGTAGRVKGFLGGFQEAVERLSHPIEGIRKGWRDLTPRDALKHMTETERAKFLKPGILGSPQHLSEYPEKRPLMDLIKSKKVQPAAEELSRRGWTGTSRIGKYLPIGGKSLNVGMVGLAAPAVINAPKATRTGEGGKLETGMGEMAGLGGMIAGSGLGMLPGLATWQIAHQGGKRLGRVLDRLRSGASIGEAVHAPSPQQVAKQMETIQKYYGPGSNQ